MFTIVIPTLNNLKYLKFCLESIYKNSKYNHQIVPHVNIGDDGTIEYLKEESIEFTHTNYNAGICKGVNLAASKAKFDFILYAHDDFYFCPDWDEILKNEIDKIGHNDFYLSGTMVHNGQIKFNCGDTIETFDEKKFLNFHKDHNFYDFQGSTWAPHLIHKNLWNRVGGFSEEFYPGTGSDPDLNMKLFKEGIKIFKGINNFKVYHFGSIVTRKYKDNKTILTETGSRGGKIFLLKWGFSIKFFKKFLIESDIPYQGPLKATNKNLVYYSYFFLNKLYYLYIRYIYNFRNKHKLLKL